MIETNHKNIRMNILTIVINKICINELFYKYFIKKNLNKFRFINGYMISEIV